MTTKRRPWGSGCTGGMGSMRRSRAFTHGPQARKRSATDWSVMDSYRAVKMPATSRKGLSKPQYKKTTRKSCAGVLTFLALTNALNSRAICTVSGGRSCKSSSKSVSGSVRGNCMGRFSCRQQGDIFTSCSMPSFSPILRGAWRLWVDAPGGEKVAHAVKPGLAIHIEPVIRGDLEGTKGFACVSSALLQVRIKHLFPTRRVYAGVVLT